MSGQLEGRVALVTGGARGIGRAIVERLAAEGASVLLLDSGVEIDGSDGDPGLAQRVAQEIGPAVKGLCLHLASPESAQQAVAAARTAFGSLDLVVNNAAILRDAFMFKAAPQDWDAVLANNLSAAFYLLNAATPHLREQAKAGRGNGSWGRILNIVSTAGLYGNLGQSAYAASKAGLFALTRVAAMEMARSGVTANALAPFAHTRVTEMIRPANEAQTEYKARALKIAPAGVAGFAAFLLGPRAGGISGQLFGLRGRELFLFSQPRPQARLLLEAGENEAALAARLEAAFISQFTGLESDLEAFNSEPFL